MWSWIGCVLGGDRISKEGTEVAPSHARKADVKRSMHCMSKLGVQTELALLADDGILYIEAGLHGGRPRSRSQKGEVYGYRGNCPASMHMSLPRN